VERKPTKKELLKLKKAGLKNITANEETKMVFVENFVQTTLREHIKNTPKNSTKPLINFGDSTGINLSNTNEDNENILIDKQTPNETSITKDINDENLNVNKTPEEMIIEETPKSVKSITFKLPIEKDNDKNLTKPKRDSTKLVEENIPIKNPVNNFNEKDYDLKISPEPFEETDWIKFNMSPKINKTFNL